MKRTFLLVSLLSLFALGGALHAQTINAAPSGIVVSPPSVSSTNVLTVRGGGVDLNPAQASAFSANYLYPALAAVGYPVPAGTVLRRVAIVLYKDGSMRLLPEPAASSSLAAPPPGFGHGSPSSTNSH